VALESSLLDSFDTSFGSTPFDAAFQICCLLPCGYLGVPDFSPIARLTCPVCVLVLVLPTSFAQVLAMSCVVFFRLLRVEDVDIEAVHGIAAGGVNRASLAASLEACRAGGAG
jgi:hypothetical protein